MDKNRTFDNCDYLFFCIIVIISFYLFVFKLPFPRVDDLVLKQPGASLAKGIGFIAPALKGSRPGIEELFAHYPPVYPFLFGIWFSIFKFSLSSSLALSFLICFSVVLIYVLLFKTILDKKLPLYIYGVIFFSWCNAIMAMHRPDTLFVLLALSILLLIIRKGSEKKGFITQVSIIILLTLSLATSLGIGLLFIVYLFFCLISVKGFNIHTIRRFCIWSFLAMAFSLSIWWIAISSNPYLVKVQYIDPQILKQTLGGIMSMKEGFIFTFYRVFQYIPLIIFLTAVFIANLLLCKNKNEKRFLDWQFLGIAMVLLFLLIKLTHKDTYITVFVFFLIFIYGVALVRVIERIKNLYLKKMLVFAIYFFLFIACSLVIRTALFPLTWQKEDTYEYNKKLILSNIEKGSKVLTDVVFWYVLDEDYKIFDSYFAPLNIYSCSYVLMASGGSGRPDLPVMAGLEENEELRRYFYKNFTKIFSTMSNQPNKILRLPISRSRWCYRFELYKRNNDPEEKGYEVQL